MSLTRAIAAAVVAVASIAPLRAPACETNFRFYNNSPLTVVHLYVTPSYDQNWETSNDFLGSDTIDSLSSYYVDVDSSWTDGGLYDIRADYNGGEHRTLYGVPLCARNRVSANYYGFLSAQ